MKKQKRNDNIIRLRDLRSGKKLHEEKNAFVAKGQNVRSETAAPRPEGRVRLARKKKPFSAAAAVANKFFKRGIYYVYV